MGKSVYGIGEGWDWGVSVPQVSKVVGVGRLMLMPWVRVMMGWHAIDVEARVTWQKNAGRQSEKGRVQWLHGTLREENGEAKGVAGKKVRVVERQ